MTLETETLRFDDQMGATKHSFKLTYSSLWHLTHGGSKLITRAVAPQIVIPRVILWLDVSKWQGNIDFVKMAGSGVHGVIIKCGQGTAKDPKFDENWTKAKAALLPRGSYWFYDSRIPPKEQANNWWNWVKADRGELMHFADYEENYGGPYAGWQNFKIFLTEFQRLSQLPDSRIGIYTGYYYWIAHSPASTAELAYFARFLLWLAWYTSNPSLVVIPRPWTALQLIAWQYGTPPNGEMRGCQSIEVDENNENDESLQDYRDRFGLSDTIPPTNGGPDPMPTLYGTATGNITMRTGPGVNFPPATLNATPQYVLNGDKLEASEESNGFWKLSKITRNGQNVILPPLAWCGSAFIRREDPPPPVVGEVPVRIELGDDITYQKQVIVTTLKPVV